MKIAQSSATLEYPTDNADCWKMLMQIERAGRTCYKSDAAFDEESAREFVAMIIKRGHLSVIEHASATVRFICDRGVSHEIVRHRIASYSQESTRYCNYSKEKFGEEITVIDPRPHMDEEQFVYWSRGVEAAERTYFALIDAGAEPQMARSVLPNSLKTELVMTANLREWRHFFTLRTAPAAHPQLTQITRPLLVRFREVFPVVFDDVGVVSDMEESGGG